MMLADDGKVMDSRIWIICLANLLLAGYLASLAWQLLQLRQGLRRWRQAVDTVYRHSPDLFPTTLLALKQVELDSLRHQRQRQGLQRSLRQTRQLLGLVTFCLAFWRQTWPPRQR